MSIKALFQTPYCFSTYMDCVKHIICYHDPYQRFYSGAIVINLICNVYTTFSKVIKLYNQWFGLLIIFVAQCIGLAVAKMTTSFLLFDFKFTVHDIRHRTFPPFRTGMFCWRLNDLLCRKLSVEFQLSLFEVYPQKQYFAPVTSLLLQCLYTDDQLKYFFPSNLPGFWFELPDALRNQW